MVHKIEGILLNKIPHQDRHLIGDLLLRSGKKLSVLFYGGQGGGRKVKVSGLEVGAFIEVTLQQGGKSHDINRTKEWIVKWTHEAIRHDHRGFTLMCFYLEVFKIVAGEEESRVLERGWDQTSQGLFSVLSNAVFRLEKRVKEKNFHFPTEITYFLGKLLIEQGVFPERNICVLSGEQIRENESLALIPAEGGFAKIVHLKSAEEQRRIGHTGSALWKLLREISITKYNELPAESVMGLNEVQTLGNYLFYQLQVDPKNLRTWSLLTQQ